MNREELLSRVATVKQSLISASNCSPAILDLLSLLLNPSSHGYIPDLIAGVRNKNAHKSVSRATRTPSAGSKKRAEVVVLEVEESQREQLSSGEKLKLALEVVNATLKGLNEVLKSPATPRIRRETKPFDRTSSPSPADSGFDRKGSKPLQARCVNEVSGGTGGSTCRRCSSLTTKNQNAPAVLAFAECARVAFATIRKLAPQGETPLAHLQLEAGMSALINKLIALELDDLAVKELRILLKRLIPTGGTEHISNAPKMGSRPTNLEEVPKKLRLTDLLRVNEVSSDPLVLDLIVASQLQIIKIITLRKQVSSIEDAHEHLQRSTLYSPINLLEQLLASPSPESRRKGAKHLDVLAQALQSLCRVFYIAQQDPISGPKDYPSPQMVLDYQMLAIEARCRFWRESGQVGDLDRELFNPFRKCLDIFARKSGMTDAETYVVATGALELFIELRSSLSAASSFKEPSKQAGLVGIYRTLADLAVKTQCFPDAARFSKMSLSALNDDPCSSTIRRCTILCRLASISLQDPESTGSLRNDEMITTLQDAILALRGDLQGSLTDLDDLLLSSAELRKVAYMALVRRIEVTEDASGITQTDSLCLELVLLSLKVLMQYFREEPKATLNSTNASTFESRLERVARVARPTIEAVVFLSRLSFAHESKIWHGVDTCLQDCVVLLESLNDYDGQKPTWRHPPYLQLSNAYWYHYLRQVQAKEDPADMKSTLKKSIALAKRVSALDSTRTMLSIKLEKLALLYKGPDDMHKARDLYIEALRAIIKDGSLRKLVEAAAARPWSTAQKEDATASFISRVLIQFSKLIHHHPSTFFFDDTTLLPEERGFLLEAQLAILISMVGHQGASTQIESAVRHISEILFEVYTVDQYPIRKLRVCVNLLHASSLYQGLLSTTLMDEVTTTSSPKESLAADSCLQRFVPYLTACQEAFSAILRGPPDTSSLRRSLDVWSTLVASCDDLAALSDQVEDIRLWLDQIYAIADFLGMQGFDVLRAQVLCLVTDIYKLQPQLQLPSHVGSLISLGLQLVRLGYSGPGGAVFQRGEKLLCSLSLEDPIIVDWHLAYAEHLLLIGNNTRSAHHIEQSKNLITSTSSTANMISTTVGCRDKQILWHMDYMRLLSLLSIAENQSSRALFCARRSVRLAYDMWALLNRRSAKAKSRDASSSVDALLGDTSGLALSKDSKRSIVQEDHKRMQSAIFWPLVPRLFHQLLDLAKIYAHDGNLPQARYYAEQSAKVAKAARAYVLEAQVNAFSGDLDVRGGRHDDGSACLAQSTKVLLTPPATQAGVIAQVALAGGALRRGEHIYSSQLLNSALNAVDGMLCSSAIGALGRVITVDDGLELQMERLALQPQRPISNAKRKQARVTKCIREPMQTPVTASMANKCFPLQQIRNRVLRTLARCALIARNPETAKGYAIEARSFSCSERETVHHGLIMAQITLYSALESLVKHPVLSILPDSTVACPSAVYGSRCPSKECIMSSGDVGLHANTKKPKGKAIPKSREKKPPAESDRLDEHLWKAFAALKDVHQLAQTACSLPVLHQAADVFTKIIMMLSAACPTAPQNTICPTLAVYAMEFGRSSAIGREKAAIKAENLLVQQGQSALKIDLEVPKCFENHTNTSIDDATFQSHFIDIIPSTWTVITISINDTRDELRLARLRANQTPFVVIIPLSRHAPGDEDDCFSFDDGKAELLDIITTANASAHSALNISKKGAKTAWWDERTGLDARLKDLLINIENIWLGGFRGIFSQVLPRQDLLSRFNRSFINILNKHLPSRQKASKLSTSAHVTLDARIMELFVDLGNPNEVGDLDEPLTDLLNFVVDVLQFNGERNAYDEIDFDSMAIETLDALRHYHQATSESTADRPAEHTILILDKALHCFPWESLPCMSGQAVSRLPSLQTLRHRLLEQGGHGDKAAGEYRINSKDGAYILNPAGDLINTEATFRKPFAELADWSSTINTIPSEEEIVSYLSTRSLYLYFGHGSGAQYIRSRTIRRLDRCAVALLMGCSSAALIEEGEFESHGTPLRYLQAGSPAVVGTLWDVTDKDIDRFSMDLLVRWGLVEGHAEEKNASPVKKSGKNKGRTQSKAKKVGGGDAASGKGKVSLDQAVGAARDACILKYLNGAAPVVYGIPVYLS